MDNRVDELYAGWPERLFVIGANGRIAYAGGPGPWGFKPDELEKWLTKNLTNLKY
jgi:type I thyroxine 5'-deiodinase